MGCRDTMIENLNCAAVQIRLRDEIRGRTSASVGDFGRFIPPSWIHFAKYVLLAEYRCWVRERLRLQRMPRYEAASTTLLGKPLRILDAASFLSMEREIFQQGIYAFSTANESPRIIDGGANIGLSVLFFKDLFPGCRLTAFEPDPRVFAVLEENVRVHGSQGIELLQRALWSAETTLDFECEGADGGRVSRQRDTGGASVQTVRLRDFLGERIDFLKLDIEGAETEVLDDCSDRLENVSNLFVEYHSFTSERQALDRLFGILADAGFRVHVHPSSHSPQPFLYRETQLGMDLQLNVFAFRS
jgi:FkbM family methyltransferase